MTPLRRDLPPLPERMKRLPVDARGWPVPWFVVWMDEQGRLTRNGQGTPDFPHISRARLAHALKERLCWVCGQKLGFTQAFVIGPMCAINRVTAEPPNHLDCADFSARACPFLSRPKMRRSTHDGPVAGLMSERNPGVALVWGTSSFRVEPDPLREPGAVLLRIGRPTTLRWYAQGRRATRAEILESIEGGYPELLEVAKTDPPGSVEELEQRKAEALRLVPAQ